MDNKENLTTNKTDHLNEALLASWLRLSTSINNSRIVSKMSYNESLVCNLLYHDLLEETGTPMTATKLCQKTKMLKSQMNRTLNQLENKGMIRRERSSIDKRLVYIQLNPEALKDYEKQHEQILALLTRIIDDLGPEQTQNAIQLFDKICDIADHLFEKGEKNDSNFS